MAIPGVGDKELAGAIGIDNVKLGITLRCAYKIISIKNDLRTIGRPIRLCFSAAVICYLDNIGSVRKHGKNLWITIDY